MPRRDRNGDSRTSVPKKPNTRQSERTGASNTVLPEGAECQSRVRLSVGVDSEASCVVSDQELVFSALLNRFVCLSLAGDLLASHTTTSSTIIGDGVSVLSFQSLAYQSPHGRIRVRDYASEHMEPPGLTSSSASFLTVTQSYCTLYSRVRKRVGLSMTANENLS